MSLRVSCRRAVGWWPSLLGLSWVLAAGPAEAFSIQNAIRPGCHEAITVDALRVVRRDLATAGPLPATGDDRAMIDDAEFDVPDDMRDLGGAALLFGLREPDLHGHSNHELDELALAHGDNDDQPQHCLRRDDDDEPSGTAAALEACRTRILTEFTRALDGLDAASAPDPARREDFAVALGLRGKVTVSMPVFHVHMGAAIHAAQDSFAHQLRTSTGMHVTTVLNWIDWVNDSFDERRDGPQHLSSMDQCDVNIHPLINQRRKLATAITETLLRAALDPALDRDQKLVSATATVEAFLVLEDGCDASNHWCDAREFDVPEPGCLCEATGRGAAAGWPAAWSGVALGLGAWWRRRGERAARERAARERAARERAARERAVRGRSRRGRVARERVARERVREDEVARGRAARWAAGLVGGALVVVVSGVARADEEAPPPVPRYPEPKPESGFAAYVAAGVSIDRAATALTLGGRYRFSSRWIVGVDGEWNPWFNTGTLRFHNGTINAYGTLIRQYPMLYESVSLRTTLNLGTSILLLDLVGAPAGRPGVFFGISPLGVEWRLRRDIYLVFDPVHIVVPVPQLTGIPFAYPQYRAVVGLEFG